MKGWTPALADHYAQRVTTLADCWKVTRQDGTVLAFTSHERDLTVDGVTYQASTSFTPSEANSSAELAVDTMELKSWLEGAGITAPDIEAGLYDGAMVENFEVDYTAVEIDGVATGGGDSSFTTDADIDGVTGWQVRWLTGANAGATSEVSSAGSGTVTLAGALAESVQAGDTFRILKGRNIKLTGFLGNPRWTSEGEVIYEVRSLAQKLQQVIGNKTQPTCVNRLGDEWCGVDLDGLQEAGAVETVHGRTAFSDTTQTQSAGYFAGGLVEFTTGNNAGYQRQVRTFDGERFELLAPFPFPFAAGDQYQARPDCFKRLIEDCRDTFDNVINFRGAPYLPGTDTLYDYPDPPIS
ncbi:DUF2163 domain-containing protein [Spectribacter hydrogenoxidans]|uniref:DUF2163 domain-containing protein n=1 Tax=Spectribacter hydrogenoxidans TaxID=3075608 RepID=A0ABU3C0Q7_9GAMM|nr:DUF2163 domain-containing protein [Salinisphaera sp. W335]MDT0635105.1 DUF2163 domain-containing protein [Salinisphaera sp. W335]